MKSIVPGQVASLCLLVAERQKNRCTDHRGHQYQGDRKRVHSQSQRAFGKLDHDIIPLQHMGTEMPCSRIRTSKRELDSVEVSHHSKFTCGLCTRQSYAEGFERRSYCSMRCTWHACSRDTSPWLLLNHRREDLLLKHRKEDLLLNHRKEDMCSLAPGGIRNSMAVDSSLPYVDYTGYLSTRWTSTSVEAHLAVMQVQSTYHVPPPCREASSHVT